MPKISIIVPVYNTGDYLEKCLTSLVNQTLDSIEIIVVNDGSTDNSNTIIENFHRKYPNKIVPFKKTNGGLSDARNFGMARSSGEYIGFVDSDDYVEPNMYQEMYNLAITEKSDLIECDFSWDFPDKSKTDKGAKYKNIADCFIYGRVMACNKIYKASVIKSNSILFPYGLLYEDVEFFYKLVPHLKKTSYINKIFYHYVQRENSIINYNNDKTDNIFNILRNLTQYYKQNKIFDDYYSYLEYLNIRLLLGSSFKRILKIKDSNVRKDLLKRNYDELQTNFPNWKKNIYLKKSKNKKNLYYRYVNKFTYKIYSIIFRIF